MTTFKRLLTAGFLSTVLVSTVGALESADLGAPCSPYIIGDKGPGGGRVYYIDDSGCHGLEAQLVDAASGVRMNWSTAIITAAAYNLPACASDAQLTPSCWHLPSKTELQYLYNQKTVVGGFANSPYWSSTGFIVKYAWTQFFNFGGQNINNKINALLVRAVRAF
ncbi:MAG: DUF1566 domain-containing protein [Methylococcales bacterium]|jgi:hypothetical protein